MTITTQLVGALGSGGYLFRATGPTTYVLPPNPQGWSVLIARARSSGDLPFKCVNRKTGKTVWASNVGQGSYNSSINPTPDLVEATRVGMNIEIKGSAEARICIASGIDNQPPTA